MTKWFQEDLRVQTAGREIRDITPLIAELTSRSGIVTGLSNIFIAHTSASLMVTENADPAVHHDLERFMRRTAPDGDTLYTHTDEGPDDMSAHVRSVLTDTSLSVPVVKGRLALGTWQGVYLWEHRVRPHVRHIVVTIWGEQ
ncbi:MAG: secondary thiamine-phosphate synthase enzyme YjbQ [Arenicellales bacterium]|jgi:secondary thiamine-phosphate synthase enzyme